MGECGSVYMWAGVYMGGMRVGRCECGPVWECVHVGKCIYGGVCEWVGVSVGQCGSVYMWAGIHMGECVSGQV